MDRESDAPHTRSTLTDSLALERRSFVLGGIEVRADGGHPRLTGHAAVFNSLSEPMYGFREQIAPGAFAESIGKDDIRALWNHDTSHVLGRKAAGTLILTEDERGLAVDIKPPPTQWAKDLLISIKRGDVSQMSFGFQVLTDSWSLVDGAEVRTLEKVRLFEVSPVTFPAYTATDIGSRSIAGVDLRSLCDAYARLGDGQHTREDIAIIRRASQLAGPTTDDLARGLRNRRRARLAAAL